MKLIKTSFEEFATYVKNEKKSILFWGAGAIGRILVPTVCKQYNLDDSVVGYIDNNPAKVGKTVAFSSSEIPIYSADFLDFVNVTDTILMITNGDFFPVLEQLKQLPTFADLKVCIAPIMKIAENEKVISSEIIKLSSAPLIPKKIHYCWFSGNPIPPQLQRCIDSWSKLCPDYEIIRWDETNYDYKKYNYTRQAYTAKKWGYIPDIARLEILYEQGGFYLDTDVELIKSLDDMRYQKGFCGREEWGHVNFGGGSGCVPHLDLVGDLLDFRKDVDFLMADGYYNLEASGFYETKPLLDQGLSLENVTQLIGELSVYSSEFFSPYNYITGRENVTEKTISIHYFSGGWLGETGKRYREETRKKYQAVVESLEEFD